MKKLLSLMALSMVFALPAAAADVGKPAPEFSVQDINGKTQSLAGYRGKIVVLEWNNPNCPFVHKHYDSGNMQSLQAYATGKGVVWISVNSGAPGKEGAMTDEQAKAKLDEWGAHPTAYVLDPEGTLGRLYGATATPHMFVIDATGTLVYEGAIDDTPSFEKADVKTAHNYVKAAIDALMEKQPVTVASTKPYGCSIKYKD